MNSIPKPLRQWSPITVVLLATLLLAQAGHAQAPYNDDPCNADPVIGSNQLTCNVTAPGSLDNATPTDVPNDCSGSAEVDVWFTFIAAHQEQVLGVYDVQGGPGIAFAVYSGDCDALSLMACSDAPAYLLTGLTIGALYHVRVYPISPTGGEHITFNVCIIATGDPPANDECSGALPVTVNTGPGCASGITGTLADATPSNVPATCPGVADDDVWFRFIATASAHRLTFLNVLASHPLDHALYTGSCGSLALVPGSCGDTNDHSIQGLVPGQVYYLRVYSPEATPANTTFRICVGPALTPPVNDECTGALPIAVNPLFTYCTQLTPGNVLGATPSPLDPCESLFIRDDVWFKFTALSRWHMKYLAHSSGQEDVDLQLRLYGGGCDNLICAEGDSLTVGETYYLRVGSASNEAPGQDVPFGICVRTRTPPANDECTGAIPVTVAPGIDCTPSAAVDEWNATASWVPSACGGTGDRDAWFSFVATASMHLIRLNAMDLGFELYTGGCEGLVPVPGTCYHGIGMPTGLMVGETYYLRVRFYPPSLSVCITTPPPSPNDECATAIPLPVNPDLACAQITSGITLGATSSNVPNGCFGNAPNDDVWFSFTATQTAHRIRFSTTAQWLGLRYTLFTGNCDSLISVSCGTNSIVDWNGLTIGETYYIRCYSQSGIPGGSTAFDICVGSPALPPNDDCSGALPLTANPGFFDCGQVTPGTLLESTPSGAITFDGYQHDDVWFSFVATTTSHTIQLLNVSGGSVGFRLFRGDCSELGTSSGGGVFNLIPGQTYYVCVYAYTSAPGPDITFDVCLGANNDNCQDAVPLTVNADLACAEIAHGTFLSSTAAELPLFADCGEPTDRDVWFSFVATAPTHRISILNINTSNADVSQGLYFGDCADVDVLPGWCTGAEISDPWGLTVGQTYYVRLYGGNQNTTFDVCIGTHTVDIIEQEKAPLITLAPNPASTELYLTVPDARTVSVRIYDMIGHLVMQRPMAKHLSIAQLAPGAYSLVAVDAQAQPVGRARFVKR